MKDPILIEFCYKFKICILSLEDGQHRGSEEHSILHGNNQSPSNGQNTSDMQIRSSSSLHPLSVDGVNPGVLLCSSFPIQPAIRMNTTMLTLMWLPGFFKPYESHYPAVQIREKPVSNRFSHRLHLLRCSMALA